MRNRVSALALAVVLASGMTTVFSTSVSAADGFQVPSNQQICADLQLAAANLNLAPAWLRPALAKAISYGLVKYNCL